MIMNDHSSGYSHKTKMNQTLAKHPLIAADMSASLEMAAWKLSIHSNLDLPTPKFSFQQPFIRSAIEAPT